MALQFFLYRSCVRWLLIGFLVTLGACRKPSAETDLASSDIAILPNSQFCQFSSSAEHYLFGLDPEGRFLIHLTKVEKISVALYTRFSIDRIGNNVKEITPLTTIEMANYFQTAPYSWTKDGDLFFAKRTNKKLGVYHIIKLPELTLKKIPVDDRFRMIRHIEGRSSPSIINHYIAQDHVSYCGWVPNISGVNILRITESTQADEQHLEISQSTKIVEPQNPQRLISGKLPPLNCPIEFKTVYIFPKSTKIIVFSSETFHPASNKGAHQSLKASIPYFFMLETKLDGHARLLKYTDKVGGGDWETVFDFGLNKNPHVSLDRYGTKIMWVRYDADTDADSYANNGSIHKPLSDTGKTLLDIVRVPGMFKASVEDMDSAGRLAIVKRSTKQGGDDYLLVDIKAKTMRLLGHCPAITNTDD